MGTQKYVNLFFFIPIANFITLYSFQGEFNLFLFFYIHCLQSGNSYLLSNRPGVIGAVLQTALSVTFVNIPLKNPQMLAMPCTPCIAEWLEIGNIFS